VDASVGGISPNVATTSVFYSLGGSATGVATMTVLAPVIPYIVVGAVVGYIVIDCIVSKEKVNPKDIQDGKFQIDPTTLRDHIIKRHGPNSTLRDKSKFIPGFNIKGGIDKTLRTPDLVIKNTPDPNGNVRKGFIFEKRFPNKIGIDQFGWPVNSLKVVIDENGNVVTAFPK
jgi:hypothetical protein